MLKARTADQALVREINLSIILNSLRDHSPISRASLASFTGLNKTTVSSLIQQLTDAHFVSELGVGRTEDAGRPGILLELNPDAGCIIGAEIGVDFISVIVTDFAARIIWRHQEQTSLHEHQDATIARTLRIIGMAAQQGCAGRNILGLGLGVPGLVDVSSGTMLFGPNLRWENVPLKEILQKSFHFPVYVDNEANMAALGESYFGVARGAKSVLYVSAGVGLGGGIVLEGQLLPGAAGLVGEVGHMTMSVDGLLCSCGNHGCWETLVSQAALFRRISAAVAPTGEPDTGRGTSLDLDHLTVPAVVEAAQAGDRVALDALHDTAVYLGIGIANLVNALNPEIVVFGGILSLASAFIVPVVERVIEERALRWLAGSMKVLVAAHGNDACVMGGIAAVYHQILIQPFRSAMSSAGSGAQERQQAATNSGGQSLELERRALAHERR